MGFESFLYKCPEELPARLSSPVKQVIQGTVAVKLDGSQRMLLINNPVSNAIQLLTQNMPASVYFYQLLNSTGQVCRKGSFDCDGSAIVAIL